MEHSKRRIFLRTCARNAPVSTSVIGRACTATVPPLPLLEEVGVPARATQTSDRAEHVETTCTRGRYKHVKREQMIARAIRDGGSVSTGHIPAQDVMIFWLCSHCSQSAADL
jgi:hypothetical protein